MNGSLLSGCSSFVTERGTEKEPLVRLTPATLLRKAARAVESPAGAFMAAPPRNRFDAVDADLGATRPQDPRKCSKKRKSTSKRPFGQF